MPESRHLPPGQRLALESRDASSKVKATFGSKLMLERRRDLPAINNERAKLEQEMQGGLFALPEVRAA